MKGFLPETASKNTEKLHKASLQAISLGSNKLFFPDTMKTTTHDTQQKKLSKFVVGQISQLHRQLVQQQIVCVEEI